MSAHTAGPWFAVANDHYWEIRTCDEQIGDACASKHLAAGDNGEANARLIAAAPELLAALLALLDRAEKELADPQDLSEVFGARAAIAKATGAPA